MSPVAKPPVTERGVVSNQPAPPSTGSGTYFTGTTDEAEHAPRWQWPNSIELVDQMLRSDTQINALRMAVTLPTKRRRYLIDPNGAEDRIVEHVANDLGLPIRGDDTKPRVVDSRRFDFKRHLHHVLLAPFYGHYYFSQYAPIAPDGLAHLRKLLPLPPRTIDEIRVAQDGGLEWVRQRMGRGRDQFGRPDPIPVSALVAYVWEQEAGNWLGQSMLRPLFRDYLAKDDLIRSNMTKHRRNGMGIPKGRQTERDADGTQAKAVQAIGQSMRAGEEAAFTLPYGYDLTMMGVEGTLPDAVPSIKMHDEAMARSFLAMFLQLGQTESGARSLGESFVDFFVMALDTLASDGVCEPTTLHVIRDLVDWNYGEDVELIPLLVSERDEDPELSVQDLAALVDKGVITVDDELEDTIRARRGLPARTAPRPPAPAPTVEPPTASASTSRAQRPAGGTARASVVRRALDRLRGRAAADGPRDFVDWDRIDSETTTASASLVDAWQTIRAEQIAAIAGLIRAADGDLSTLAQLRAPTLGATVITAAMASAADLGVETATQEAADQGVTLPDPWTLAEAPAGGSASLGDFLGREASKLKRLIEARSSAIAETLAGSLSEVASRQAVEQTGDSTTVEEVVLEVVEHLEGLTDAFLEEQLGAAIHQGFNAGRRETMRGAPEGTRIEASALLDGNQCGPCSLADGHVYDSLDDAEYQFPTGGNKACEGGLRCRCTLVMVLDEAEPTVR